MPSRIVMTVTVQVDGNPFWTMAKEIKPELARRLTEKEYEQVVVAAGVKLGELVKRNEKTQG